MMVFELEGKAACFVLQRLAPCTSNDHRFAETSIAVCPDGYHLGFPSPTPQNKTCQRHVSWLVVA